MLCRIQQNSNNEDSISELRKHGRLSEQERKSTTTLLPTQQVKGMKRHPSNEVFISQTMAMKMRSKLPTTPDDIHIKLLADIYSSKKPPASEMCKLDSCVLAIRPTLTKSLKSEVKTSTTTGILPKQFRKKSADEPSNNLQKLTLKNKSNADTAVSSSSIPLLKKTNIGNAPKVIKVTTPPTDDEILIVRKRLPEILIKELRMQNVEKKNIVPPHSNTSPKVTESNLSSKLNNTATTITATVLPFVSRLESENKVPLKVQFSRKRMKEEPCEQTSKNLEESRVEMSSGIESTSSSEQTAVGVHDTKVLSISNVENKPRLSELKVTLPTTVVESSRDSVKYNSIIKMEPTDTIPSVKIECLDDDDEKFCSITVKKKNNKDDETVTLLSDDDDDGQVDASARSIKTESIVVTSPEAPDNPRVGVCTFKQISGPSLPAPAPTAISSSIASTFSFTSPQNCLTRPRNMFPSPTTSNLSRMTTPTCTLRSRGSGIIRGSQRSSSSRGYIRVPSNDVSTTKLPAGSPVLNNYAPPTRRGRGRPPLSRIAAPLTLSSISSEDISPSGITVRSGCHSITITPCKGNSSARGRPSVRQPSSSTDVEGTILARGYGYGVSLFNGAFLPLSDVQVEKLREQNNGVLPAKLKIPVPNDVAATIESRED